MLPEVRSGLGVQEEMAHITSQATGGGGGGEYCWSVRVGQSSLSGHRSRGARNASHSVIPKTVKFGGGAHCHI